MPFTLSPRTVIQWAKAGFFFLGLGLLGMTVHCSRPPLSDVQVRLVLPASRGATRGVTSDNLDCFLLNVTGPGLVPTVSASLLGACYLGKLGTISSVVPRPASTGPNIVDLRLRVPAGEARSVQVLGIATGQGTAGCQSKLADFFSPGQPPVQLYEFGKTPSPVGLFRDTELTIYNEFQPGDLLQGCSHVPPPANGTLLTLTDGYQGLASSGGGDANFGEFFNFHLPPQGSQNLPNLVPLAAIEVAGINNGSGFITSVSPTNLGYGRLDLVFSTQSHSLSDFSSLQVVLSGVAGGTTPYNPLNGSCNPTPFIPGNQSPQFNLRPAANPGGSGAWVDVGFNPAVFAPSDYSFVIPGPLSTYAVTELDTVSSTTDTYFHFSLRTRDLSKVNSSCSDIQIQGAKLYLVP